jgi:hypothetical protein
MIVYRLTLQWLNFAAQRYANKPRLVVAPDTILQALTHFRRHLLDALFPCFSGARFTAMIIARHRLVNAGVQYKPACPMPPVFFARQAHYLPLLVYIRMCFNSFFVLKGTLCPLPTTNFTQGK